VLAIGNQKTMSKDESFKDFFNSEENPDKALLLRL
jgi:hypothetical protein